MLLYTFVLALVEMTLFYSLEYQLATAFAILVLQLSCKCYKEATKKDGSYIVVIAHAGWLLAVAPMMLCTDNFFMAQPQQETGFVLFGCSLLLVYDDVMQYLLLVLPFLRMRQLFKANYMPGDEPNHQN